MHKFFEWSRKLSICSTNLLFFSLVNTFDVISGGPGRRLNEANSVVLLLLLAVVNKGPGKPEFRTVTKRAGRNKTKADHG